MPNSDYKNFLQRPFLFVTGKGGAGKSVVATSVALALAASGKRVLLAEIGNANDRSSLRLHELLGTTELGHKVRFLPHSLEKDVSLAACRIDPMESLFEYLQIKLHSSRIPSLLLKNKVTKNFLGVVPGLSELVSLGKIWHLVASNSNNKDRPYDHIVLDGPASGHAITLLSAPKNFAELTKVGPIFNDANKMTSFLRDPLQTGIIYCALPEEMPLQEAIEFREKISQLASAPRILINKVFPNWFSSPIPEFSSDHPLFRTTELVKQRLQRESAFIAKFTARFPGELWQLPYEFSQEIDSEVTLPPILAEHFQEGAS